MPTTYPPSTKSSKEPLPKMKQLVADEIKNSSGFQWILFQRKINWNKTKYFKSILFSLEIKKSDNGTEMLEKNGKSMPLTFYVKAVYKPSTVM